MNKIVISPWCSCRGSWLGWVTQPAAVVPQLRTWEHGDTTGCAVQIQGVQIQGVLCRYRVFSADTGCQTRVTTE